MVIGIIGLILLILSWGLKLTKWKDEFYLWTGISAMLLITYSYLIKDLVFVVANSWIAIIAIWTYGKSKLK